MTKDSKAIKANSNGYSWRIRSRDWKVNWDQRVFLLLQLYSALHLWFLFLFLLKINFFISPCKFISLHSYNWKIWTPTPKSFKLPILEQMFISMEIIYTQEFVVTSYKHWQETNFCGGCLFSLGSHKIVFIFLYAEKTYAQTYY